MKSRHINFLLENFETDETVGFIPEVEPMENWIKQVKPIHKMNYKVKPYHLK